MRDGKKKHSVLVKNDSNNSDEVRERERETMPIPIEEMYNVFHEKGDMRIYNYF